MSGSFWKFTNGFTLLLNVLVLLEQHNTSGEEGDHQPEALLAKLLDESDLLQELLLNNTLLLEFLRGDQVLALLVGLVVNEGRNSWMNVVGGVDDSASTSNSTTSDDPQEIVIDEKTEVLNSSDKNEKDSNTKVDKETNESNSSEGDNDHDDDDDLQLKLQVGNSDKEDYDITNKNHHENEDDEQDNYIEKAEDEPEEEEEEEESQEEKEVRHATLAAEILAADVWSLTDTVMESTITLDNLWSILDLSSALSINLLTFFMKIMEHLLDMKCDEMITYLIENQLELVSKFMNHLLNPPLMDFLLKLISTDKPDNLTGIVDFLQRQSLIPRLISALDVDESVAEEQLLMRQSSAADFLKALITILANSTTDLLLIGPNELTRELVLQEQMERLSKIMLKGEYALANGVGIIIEIIRKNNSDYDLLPVLYITLDSHPPTGRDPIYLGHLLRVFAENINEFNKLLLTPSKNKLKTPFGEIEPLGFERFKICELIAELLHCSNMALLNDNKGFDIVKERDDVRNKMKEYDAVSFKYNEVIVLPEEISKSSNSRNVDDVDVDGTEGGKVDVNSDSDDCQSAKGSEETSPSAAMQSLTINDTINLFNSKDDTFEETHANANLTEEQLRANPVVGDFLKIALYDTQIILNVLGMFFEFPWNNFLHNVVFDIVQQVLNGLMDIGFNKFLAIDLFDKGNITNKIVSGQQSCQKYELENNGLRLGYMGHLTLIAEEVVKFLELYPVHSLSELIDDKVEDSIWEDYVNDVLYDTRAKYNALLGGGEEEDTTFDEGVGEIIELEAGKFDAVEELEDDDHFLNYMLQELNTDGDDNASNPVAHLLDEEDLSEDEDLRNNDHQSSTVQKHNLHSSEHQTRIHSTTLANTNTNSSSSSGDDDDDDYIDPNDDGLLYKRPSHPLYGAHGALAEEDDDLSEDLLSSDEEDDGLLSTGDEGNDKGIGNKLTRAASKS